MGTSRFAGYLDALAAAGIKCQSPLDHPTAESSFQDAYALTQGFLALPPAERPTAIVALDDTLAIGAIRAALDAGLAVGPEFGVTGFDDTPGIQHFSPSLTSVRQPVLQVAETLIPMLFQLIDGQRRSGQSHSRTQADRPLPACAPP